MGILKHSLLPVHSSLPMEVRYCCVVFAMKPTLRALAIKYNTLTALFLFKEMFFQIVSPCNRYRHHKTTTIAPKNAISVFMFLQLRNRTE